LAALLRQPIILIGHHNDLASGLEILKDTADRVNILKHVRWADMDEIVFSLFLTRCIGDTMIVQMQARKARVPIPPNIRSVLIERSWSSVRGFDQEILSVTIVNGSSVSEPFLVRGQMAEPLPVPENSILLIEAAPKDLERNGDTLPWPPPVWAYARRIACEARDRATPMVESFRRLALPK